MRGLREAAKRGCRRRSGPRRCGKRPGTCLRASAVRPAIPRPSSRKPRRSARFSASSARETLPAPAPPRDAGTRAQGRRGPRDGVLGKRMGRFALTLHPDKTRLLPFRRPPAAQTSGKGLATFDFLGFTLHRQRARSGRWGMMCKTRQARLRRAVQAVADWRRRYRHLSVKSQHRGDRVGACAHRGRAAAHAAGCAHLGPLPSRAPAPPRPRLSRADWRLRGCAIAGRRGPEAETEV